MTGPGRFGVNQIAALFDQLFGPAADAAFWERVSPLLYDMMLGTGMFWGSTFVFAMPDPDDRLHTDFRPLLRHHEPRLVEVTAGTRRAVAQIVQDLLDDGQPWSAVATRVQSLVGLTSRQWEAVQRLEARRLAGGASADQAAAAATRYARQLRTRRAETIARTETGIAWALANRQLMRDRLVQGRLWITSRDERVRGTHRPMDNQCRGLHEAFLTGAGVALMHPHDPAGPPEEIINCFLPDTAVSGRFVAGLKARYAGPVREIETRRGHRLTVTPNHPILTRRGMVPANRLTEGDDLIAGHRGLHGRVEGDVNHEDGPARIEDVFQALAADGALVPAVVGAHDLHGDAVWGNGHVDVVGANRELAVGGEAGIGQQGDDLALQLADARHALVERPGATDFPFERVGRTAARRPSALELARGTSFALDLLPLQVLGLGPAADWHVPLTQKAKQGGPAHTEFLRQLLQAGAGAIAVDQVVRIRERMFDGHVYDVQSIDGWIMAEGIICSNCRCVEVPFPAGCGARTPRPLRSQADRDRVQDQVHTAQARGTTRLARTVARLFREYGTRLSDALSRLTA